MPRAATPSAPVRLPLGGDHGAGGRAALRTLEQQCIRGFGHVEQLDAELRCPCSEMAQNDFVFEQSERCGELVAASANPVELDSGSIQPVESIPNARPRDAQRSRHLLTRAKL